MTSRWGIVMVLGRDLRIEYVMRIDMWVVLIVLKVGNKMGDGRRSM